MVKVKLIKLHTHKGVQYTVGDSIEVDNGTAKWLVEQGIGVVVESRASSPRDSHIVLKIKGE